MDAIEATCPPEDRVPDRRVFPRLTEVAAWKAMDGASKAARVPHYHPHDLRHRRISLWHLGRVPAREIADRVGHAQTSMTLDRYSHVMLSTREVPVGVFRALVGGITQASPPQHSTADTALEVGFVEPNPHG
jgi:integrase